MLLQERGALPPRIRCKYFPEWGDVKVAVVDSDVPRLTAGGGNPPDYHSRFVNHSADQLRWGVAQTWQEADILGWYFAGDRSLCATRCDGWQHSPSSPSRQ